MSNTSTPRFGFDAYFSQPQIQSEGTALPLRTAINFTDAVTVPTDNDAFDRTDVPLVAGSSGGGGGSGGSGGVTGGYTDFTGNMFDVDIPNDGTIHTSGSYATMLGVTAPASGDSKEFTLIVGTIGQTQIYDNEGHVATNGLSLPVAEADLLAGAIIRFGYNHTINRFVPLYWNDAAAGILGPLPTNCILARNAGGFTYGSSHFTHSVGYPRICGDRTGGAADSTDLGFGYGGTIGIRSANTYSGVRVDWLAMQASTYNSGAKELLTFGMSEDGSVAIHAIWPKAKERFRISVGLPTSGDYYPAGLGASGPGDASFGDTQFGYAWPNFLLAGSLPTIEAFGADPFGGGKGYAWVGDVYLVKTGTVAANGFAIWSNPTTHHPTVTIHTGSADEDHDLLAAKRGAKIDMAGANLDVSSGAKGAFVSNVRCIKIESTVTLAGDITLTLPGPSTTGTDTPSGLGTFDCLTWLVRCDFVDNTHKVTLVNPNGGQAVTIGAVGTGSYEGPAKRFAIVSSDADGVWMHGWSDENTSGYKAISGVSGS